MGDSKMKRDFIYWLRWVGVIPGAFFCGSLAYFLLHWIRSAAISDPYMFVETPLAAFIFTFAFVWAVPYIAPENKHITTIVLSVILVVLVNGLIFLSLFGTPLEGYHLFLISNGLGAIMTILGAILGFYASKNEIRNNR
jgi:hypothetical protein